MMNRPGWSKALLLEKRGRGKGREEQWVNSLGLQRFAPMDSKIFVYCLYLRDRILTFSRRTRLPPPPCLALPGCFSRQSMFTFYRKSSLKTKAYFLASVLPLVLLLDIVTKRWALEALNGQPSELFGGLVPLTLAFNRGAAFGLSIGNDPRWFFIPVTILALGLLTVLVVQTDSADKFRILALSLVLTGALGNLIDRVRWDRGVVDFIGPINLGFMDWPIFNVADMAISCGAVALAISFWMEETESQESEAELAVNGDPEVPAEGST